eukprot:3528863-Prymnesium_polylepis.1
MNHGITGMAALSLRRKFIGVEFDAHGFKLAKARIEDYFKLSFDQQGYDGVEFSDTDTAPLLADQEQEVQQMEQPALFHCDECNNNITGIRYHKSEDYDLCVRCFESLSASAQGEYTPASNCFYKRPRGRDKKGMLWDSTFGEWVSIGYEPTAAPTSTPKKRKQIHEATTEFTTARVTRVTRSGFACSDTDELECGRPTAEGETVGTERGTVPCSPTESGGVLGERGGGGPGGGGGTEGAICLHEKALATA